MSKVRCSSCSGTLRIRSARRLSAGGGLSCGAIPPDAERMFAQRMGATTVEVASSHLAMVSHTGEVVELIEAAAEAVDVSLSDRLYRVFSRPA